MSSFVRSGEESLRTRAALRRISSSWIARSAALNFGGSVIDYALLFGLTHFAGAPTVLAAITGLFVGATFNFAMNRRFAFGDRKGPVGAQALRYALGIGTLLLVHTALLSTLVDRGLLPLLAAKPLCDLVVLGAGQLVVLRLFVFTGVPEPRGAPTATSEAKAALAALQPAEP